MVVLISEKTVGRSSVDMSIERVVSFGVSEARAAALLITFCSEELI